VLALGCKLIATSFTLGSARPAGASFPAVFIGAMLAAAHSVSSPTQRLPGNRLFAGSLRRGWAWAAVVAGATLAAV